MEVEFNTTEQTTDRPMFPFVEFEPADDYHARSKSGEFVSSHLLADFRTKGPLYYHKKITGEIPDKDSAAYLVGRATHTFILEGEQAFDKEYVVADGPINEKTGNPYGKETKAYKEWFALQNKQIISTLDFALIETMADSVRNHPIASAMLAKGVAEGVVRAEIQEIGCQIRCDWLSPEYGIIDLKTCDDIDWFEVDAKKYGYYHQAAFYQRVIFEAAGRKPDFIFIVVEKKEPFRCGVWAINERSMEMACDTNINALMQLQACRDTKIWPTGYEDVRVLETKYL
jgi:hypothetical protein